MIDRGLRIGIVGATGAVGRVTLEYLVDRGHEVTVFCRPGYSPETGETYRGIRLAQLPTVKARGGEAFVHSGLSAMASLGNRYDVAHFHAVGPGLFSPFVRLLTRARVVQTIHGLDGERAKWGRVASVLLRFGTWLSAKVPHATIVVSKALQEA